MKKIWSGCSLSAPYKYFRCISRSVSYYNSTNHSIFAFNKGFIVMVAFRNFDGRSRSNKCSICSFYFFFTIRIFFFEFKVRCLQDAYVLVWGVKVRWIKILYSFIICQWKSIGRAVRNCLKELFTNVSKLDSRFGYFKYMFDVKWHSM